VLDSTPNVLSLGRRVVVGGYAFFWPAWSYSPWLQHPSTGEKVWLKVRDFVPYLDVPAGDAQPRTWEHGSRGDRVTAAVQQLFHGGYSGDAAAEIELIKQRLIELYAKESSAPVAPARAGDYRLISNWPHEGEIPSPHTGEEPDPPPDTGDAPSSSSHDAVPPLAEAAHDDVEVPPPPHPPPIADTLQRRADLVMHEAFCNAEAGRSVEPPPLPDLDLPENAELRDKLYGPSLGPAEEDDPGYARFKAAAEGFDCPTRVDETGDEW